MASRHYFLPLILTYYYYLTPLVTPIATRFDDTDEQSRRRSVTPVIPVIPDYVIEEIDGIPPKTKDDNKIMIGPLIKSNSFATNPSISLPNPTLEFRECGMDKRAVICDPHHILSTAERYEINGMLLQGYRGTENKDLSFVCRARGLTIAVGLTRKIPSERNKATANEMEAWGKRLRRKWNLEPTCRKDLLIAVSFNDQKIVTLADPQKTGIDNVIKRSVYRKILPLIRRGEFSNGLAAMIQEYVDMYRSFQSTLPRRRRRHPRFRARAGAGAYSRRRGMRANRLQQRPPQRRQPQRLGPRLPPPLSLNMNIKNATTTVGRPRNSTVPNSQRPFGDKRNWNETNPNNRRFVLKRKYAIYSKQSRPRQNSSIDWLQKISKFWHTMDQGAQRGVKDNLAPGKAPTDNWSIRLKNITDVFLSQFLPKIAQEGTVTKSSNQTRTVVVGPPLLMATDSETESADETSDKLPNQFSSLSSSSAAIKIQPSSLSSPRFFVDDLPPTSTTQGPPPPLSTTPITTTKTTTISTTSIRTTSSTSSSSSTSTSATAKTTAALREPRLANPSLKISDSSSFASSSSSSSLMRLKMKEQILRILSEVRVDFEAGKPTPHQLIVNFLFPQECSSPGAARNGIPHRRNLTARNEHIFSANNHHNGDENDGLLYELLLSLIQVADRP